MKIHNVLYVIGLTGAPAGTVILLLTGKEWAFALAVFLLVTSALAGLLLYLRSRSRKS